MGTCQLECDALTYRAFVLLSIVCDKVTDQWREIFEEDAKEGGSFWNNVDISSVVFRSPESKPARVSARTFSFWFGT